MAEIFSEDFTNLTAWTSTVESGNTVEAASGAAQNGDNALHIVVGGTNDDARLDRSDLGGVTTIYASFEFKIATGSGFTESAADSIIMAYDPFDVIPFAIDEQSEDNELQTYAGSYVESNFAFSENTWYACHMKVVQSATVGEIFWETSTDNSSFTTRVNRTSLNTGSTNYGSMRCGHDGPSRNVEFWIAHLYLDDAAYPDLPWTGSGSTVPVFHHHYSTLRRA